MSEFVTSGHPCWIDLSTSDISGAVRFYRELLGWDVVVNTTPMGDYHVGRIEGRDVAGMMAQSEAMAGMPPGWFVIRPVCGAANVIGRGKPLPICPLT